MINIQKSLSEGFKTLKKKPIIFIPALIMAILSVLVPTNLSPVSVTEAVKWFLLLIVVTLINTFLSGLIIRIAYVRRKKYLSLEKQSKFVIGKYITLLITHIIYILSTVFGLIILIIPGIFLAIKLGFYPYAVLIDKKGVGDSLKKSWNITKNNWWNVFALMLIFIIFAGLFGLVSGLISMVSPILHNVPLFFLYLFILPWIYSSLLSAYLQLRK